MKDEGGTWKIQQIRAHTDTFMHTYARTRLLGLSLDAILLPSLFSFRISLPPPPVLDTSDMICLQGQCPWLGVLISLQVLTCRFSEISGEHFFPSHRQMKSWDEYFSDWWLSGQLKASRSAGVLFVTVKGTTIWRRGGPAAADVENGVPQGSLRNRPNLSPTYAKEETEIGKGQERMAVLPLLAPVLCLVFSSHRRTALVCMYVCLYILFIWDIVDI